MFEFFFFFVNTSVVVFFLSPTLNTNLLHKTSQRALNPREFTKNTRRRGEKTLTLMPRACMTEESAPWLLSSANRVGDSIFPN